MNNKLLLTAPTNAFGNILHDRKYNEAQKLTAPTNAFGNILG